MLARDWIRRATMSGRVLAVCHCATKRAVTQRTNVSGSESCEGVAGGTHAVAKGAMKEIMGAKMPFFLSRHPDIRAGT